MAVVVFALAETIQTPDDRSCSLDYRYFSLDEAFEIPLLPVPPLNINYSIYLSRANARTTVSSGSVCVIKRFPIVCLNQVDSRRDFRGPESIDPKEVLSSKFKSSRVETRNSPDDTQKRRPLIFDGRFITSKHDGGGGSQSRHCFKQHSTPS